MLHEDPKKEENAAVAKEAAALNAVNTGATTEEESSERTLTATTRTGPVPTSEFVALRTVPVYVTSGKLRLKVNALLDDASSRTYLTVTLQLSWALKADHTNLQLMYQMTTRKG